MIVVPLSLSFWYADCSLLSLSDQHGRPMVSPGVGHWFIGAGQRARNRRMDVKASLDWLSASGAEFSAGAGLRGLVVQGVGSRFERGLLQRVAGWVLASYPLPSDNAFVNQFFNLLFGGRQKSGPLFKFVTRQCWQTDQSVMAHRFRLAERFNVVDRLSRIRVPSLILSGERDLLVSPESLKVLHEGIEDSLLVPLKRCGHLAFATQPRRIAEEVRRFLQPLNAC